MNDLIKHGRELLRALRNRHYEKAENGLLFPRQHVMVGGYFTTWVNEGEQFDVDHNLVPSEGLVYLLNTGYKAGTPASALYLAPFSGNITPSGSITAANFTSTATEFTSYDETTRVQWQADAVSGTSVANATTKAAFTMSTGVASQTLYGAGLLSASAKSSTSGSCLAATRFSSPKTGLNAGDVLNVQYTVSMSST